MPFYLAFIDWLGPLPYIAPRAVVSDVLRWLILMYGGLNVYKAWREVAGFCVRSWMPHRLGDSPAGVGTGCKHMILVCTSILYGVCNVIVVYRTEHVMLTTRLMYFE